MDAAENVVLIRCPAGYPQPAREGGGQEKAPSKAGKIAKMVKADLLVFDELGYLPFSTSAGAMPFPLLSKLYERTSVVIMNSP